MTPIKIIMPLIAANKLKELVAEDKNHIEGIRETFLRMTSFHEHGPRYDGQDPQTVTEDSVEEMPEEIIKDIQTGREQSEAGEIMEFDSVDELISWLRSS